MPSPREPSPDFEQRLDQLREEALAKGTVTGDRVRAAGAPLPPDGILTPEKHPGPGYYNLPMLKPPVWKWMIAAYFFVGGLAGMSGLIAVAALLKHDWPLVEAALWPAAVGAIISPILLIWDLGRPTRFINMLRVLKVQSPMSLGSWFLAAFGGGAIPALLLTLWHVHNIATGAPLPAVHVLAIIAIVITAAAGIFLATYTGALLGATAVPAWHLHRAILPVKFGVAGLGSAAGLLELLGHRAPALQVIGYGAAIAQTFVMLSLELNKHGIADRVLHQGASGWTLRAGETLEGPLSLVLRLLGGAPAAAVSFLLGALLTRFGWLAAGRRSATEPQAVLAAQEPPHGTRPQHA